MSKYWRCVNDGRTDIHLEGPVGDSYTLCGLDTAGDPFVHDKAPELLKGDRHRITCGHCLEVIACVQDYLKEKQRK